MLPRLSASWRQVFGHPIIHLAGAIAQEITQCIELLNIISPIHKLLALLLTQVQPVVQLQLEDDELEFAARSDRDAAPATDEIVLKSKTVAGLMHRNLVSVVAYWCSVSWQF